MQITNKIFILTDWILWQTALGAVSWKKVTEGNIHFFFKYICLTMCLIADFERK